MKVQVFTTAGAYEIQDYFETMMKARRRLEGRGVVRVDLFGVSAQMLFNPDHVVAIREVPSGPPTEV